MNNVMYHPNSKPAPEKLTYWKRIKSLLSQFLTENRVYHGGFMYQGKNLMEKVDSEIVTLEKRVKLLQEQGEAPSVMQPVKVIRDIQSIIKM